MTMKKKAYLYLITAAVAVSVILLALAFMPEDGPEDLDMGVDQDEEDQDDVGPPTFGHAEYTLQRTGLLSPSGKLRIEITDERHVPAHELQYTITVLIKGTLGVVYTDETYDVWVPYTDVPIFGLFNLIPDDVEPETKGISITATVDGKKYNRVTDYYSESFAGLGMAGGVYIGVDDGIAYRLMTEYGGSKYIWDLTSTSIEI